MSIGLEHYLLLSAVLFAIGLYGALSRRSAIVMLMCIELMMNAVNITLVAFSRFVAPVALSGQVFTIFSIVVAAAEATIGLGIIIAIYRHFENIDTSRINLLKW